MSKQAQNISKHKTFQKQFDIWIWFGIIWNNLKQFGIIKKQKSLYIIFPILGLLFLANHAQAGIIVRPVLNTGLVGYWDFQEGAGSTVYDKSGYRNNGVVNGAVTRTDGKIGQGLLFAGDTRQDIVSMSNPGELQITGSLTVSAWVKAHTIDDEWFISKADGSSSTWSYLAAVTTDNVVKQFAFLVKGASQAVRYTSTTLQDNTWYHMVGVYDSSARTLKTYLNGVNDSGILSGTVPASMTNTNTGFVIPGEVGYFDGLIDEVRVYNRALSESEINRLYKLSQPKININQLGIVDPQLPANATISYVREDCTGYSPCYNTLFAWEAAFGGFGWDGCTTGDLTCLGKTAVAKIDGTWNSPDTTATTITGWTTDASNYIHIYTTESARHPGKWDETKYRLERACSSSCILLSPYEEYIKIDGLQMKVSNTAAVNTYLIINYVDNVNSGLYLSNNIFRAGALDASTSVLSAIDGLYSASQNFYIWNNIIYDFNVNSYGTAIRVGAGTGYTKNAYVYNNTIINCYYGLFSTNSDSIFYAKNNIINGSGNANTYTGIFDVSTDYNSTDGTDITGQGAHSRISQQFAFVGAANDDFHLSPADSGARNYGLDLSNDASISFAFDIDRQPRGGTWDIGADEAKGTVVGASQKNQVSDGLVGYWSFNGPDIDGTDAFDRSSSGNHGVITGATKTIGKVGQALSFNGASAGINLSSPDSLDDIENQGGGGMSISAWVYPTATSADQHTIMTKGSGSSGAWIFYLASAVNYSIILRFAKDYSTTDLNVDSSYGDVVAGKWQHVAVTWDGSSSASNVHLYVDGVDKTPSRTNGSGDKNSDASTVAYIGRNQYSIYYDGKIDEVRAYNRALSAEEIKRLYNLGR